MIIGITLSGYNVSQVFCKINMEKCTKCIKSICAKYKNVYTKDKNRLTKSFICSMLNMLGSEKVGAKLMVPAFFIAALDDSQELCYNQRKKRRKQ